MVVFGCENFKNASVIYYSYQGVFDFTTAASNPQRKWLLPQFELLFAEKSNFEH